ncbi:MAG: hypothetical protein Q4G67_08625 [Actinomycetia bacterium]|nr:hypothetical protein [Actinomycetes bacterium]
MNARVPATWVRTLLIWGNAFALAVIVTVGLIRIIGGVDLQILTADAGAVEAHPVAGFMSNVGILIWGACAGITLFASRLSSGWRRGFLTVGTLLTLGLAVDDAFMLHDEVLPLTGIPEEVWLFVIAAAVLAFFITRRQQIMAGPRAPMALAILGFALMLGLDLLEPLGLLTGHAVIEEGFKLIGIVNWTIYFVLVAAAAIVDRGESRPSQGPRAPRR